MPAAHFTFELPVNGVWRYDLSLLRSAPVRQDPNRRAPVNLTGYDAKLQARRKVGAPVLITLSTRLIDEPHALIPALDEKGQISWTLDLTSLNLAVGYLRYDLLLIDPDQHPEPILEGQIQLIAGITVYD